MKERKIDSVRPERSRNIDCDHPTANFGQQPGRMSDTMSEHEQKKLVVRKRLQEEAMARARRKGFMTPERKKKLRLMIRRGGKHGSETLEQEQRRMAQQRRVAIEKRCGDRKSTEGLTRDQLLSLCKEYHDRIGKLEGEKFDEEKQVEVKNGLINDLIIAVNEQPGRFIKPALKKVHKINKFATLEKKAAEFSFWKELKSTKKKEFSVEEPDLKKPDWSLSKKSESPKKSSSGEPVEETEVSL